MLQAKLSKEGPEKGLSSELPAWADKLHSLRDNMPDRCPWAPLFGNLEKSLFGKSTFLLTH